MNISLEEHFQGNHRLYLQTFGESGYTLSTATNIYFYGVEIDPYPDIHAKHSDDIEIYGAFDKERHEVGDEISVVGRVNPDIDVDSSKISVFDDDGNKVHETSIDISDYYNEIATIDTTGWNPGNYTLEVSVTDTDNNVHTKEATFNLEPEKIRLDIDRAVKHDGKIDIYGTADFLESGTYELRYYIDSDTSWENIATVSEDRIDGILGSLDAGDYPYSEILLDLVAVSEDGYIKSVSKQLVIVVVTPTPTVTPTGTPTTTPTVTPTPTPIVFTEDELFVDIDDSQDGKDITFITDITGTVKGTLLQDYTLEVFPVGSDTAVYSKAGTEAIEDGVLGTLDPTLLMNGYYKVVLTGNTADAYITDEIVVLVTGQAKIGNYSMTFLDMTLPVSGLPVEVYRTYDSRQSVAEHTVCNMY